MLRLFPRLMLVVGIGRTGAACQTTLCRPRGFLSAGPTATATRTNSGYYSPAPAPSRYGYTTVTVENRGQNGGVIVTTSSAAGRLRKPVHDGLPYRTAPRC